MKIFYKNNLQILSSKKFLGLILSIFFLFFQSISAQDIYIKIKIASENRISVEGQFLKQEKAFKNFSFIDDYADAANLAKRIENFQAFFDDKASQVEARKVLAGEYQLKNIPRIWKYEIDLKPSAKITDSAHASWLTKDYGILMLADILPDLKISKSETVRIDFELPKDFKISASFLPVENYVLGSGNGNDKSATIPNSFVVNDLTNRIFFIGRNLRAKTVQISASPRNYPANFVISGEWEFTDEQAAMMIKSILEEYGKVFKQLPNVAPQIIVAPFPQENVGTERWRAETRGATVTIISGKIPLKSVAVQRLHEQLRHEIFHLWIPNAVNLSGNYDWFYEGFTLYQALRTGVEVNQISFQDYLKTLSRAYDISQELSETQSFSLIDASNKRWIGSDVFIYAKGMMAAFLCDAALIEAGKGKRDLRDVFRKVFENHHEKETVDGNTAILNLLKNYPELIPIVKNYIEGNSRFQIESNLEAAGLEFEPKAQKRDASKLRVKEKLSGRQKDLLDKLGYNQWRKLLQNKK